MLIVLKIVLIVSVIVAVVLVCLNAMKQLGADIHQPRWLFGTPMRASKMTVGFAACACVLGWSIGWLEG